jgi:hypothetical protein
VVVRRIPTAMVRSFLGRISPAQTLTYAGLPEGMPGPEGWARDPDWGGGPGGPVRMLATLVTSFPGSGALHGDREWFERPTKQQCSHCRAFR